MEGHIENSDTHHLAREVPEKINAAMNVEPRLAEKESAVIGVNRAIAKILKGASGG
jgi:hypothetical protein